MYHLLLYIDHLYGLKVKHWVIFEMFDDRSKAIKAYDEKQEEYDDDFQWEVVYISHSGERTTIRPDDGSSHW